MYIQTRTTFYGLHQKKPSSLSQKPLVLEKLSIRLTRQVKALKKIYQF